MTPKLKHVDYNCGGTVRGGKQGVLTCSSRAMSSALRPFTAISEPQSAAFAVHRKGARRRERRLGIAP